MKKINKELLQSIKVLYVEDEDMIREEVTYFFKKHIPDFYTAKDGEEGIAKFNLIKPDLVITDIQMPKLNGIDMIKELNTNIPIIITTAYSDIEFFLQAIELNILKFVIKPINLKDLIFDIQDAIIGSRLKDKLYEKENLLNIVDENVLLSITDKDGIIIDASSAFCEFVKYSKNELIGNSHKILKHEGTPDSFYEDMWDVINSGKIFKSDIRNKKKNGDVYWANITITPVFNDEGIVENYTAIRQDITNKKRLEQLAIEDELTKLYNRRYFNKIIEKEIGRIRREESILSVACIDIDYFKNFNDTYGHPKGDKALFRVAEVLKTMSSRGSDFAFRMGGEEFCIIFSGISKEDSLSFIKDIVREIENLKIENISSPCSSYLTISAGLIVLPYENLLSSSKIYSYADTALYKAKKRGKNQVYFSEY